MVVIRLPREQRKALRRLAFERDTTMHALLLDAVNRILASGKLKQEAAA